ncbi:MAG TPA: hypothetical protein VMN38_06725 [Sphingomicrobium sp.]|nr:hypothetical protein [Sphingomicrobium sp.]
MAGSEDVAQLTYELLKRVNGKIDAMAADIADLKIRVSAVETTLGQQAIQIGALNARMDRFDERLGRIERASSWWNTDGLTTGAGAL